jgi:DnaJ-class molecular chaperone
MPIAPPLKTKTVPQSTVEKSADQCIACGGTGKSSHGGKCVPCLGKGTIQKVTWPMLCKVLAESVERGKGKVVKGKTHVK